MLLNTAPADLRAICDAAAAAAPLLAAMPPAERAAGLRALADALLGAREVLVPLADGETQLGTARLNGELDRTAFQLRSFATWVESGGAQPVLDEPAQAGAPPVGRPRLTRVAVPLGPVAVFAASNFPFAFSVLGGDTASALAAGCPVVVKAHPGHPALSNAVVDLAQRTLRELGWPAGTLQAVQGGAPAVGVALVRDPEVAAVAFTGSTAGGLALWREAQARSWPIPFYGELGAVNPVVALPSALQARSAELASTLAGSVVLGCGQFCTRPGVVLVPHGDLGLAFEQQLTASLAATRPHAMLHAGIRAAFNTHVARLHGHGAVKTLLAAPAGDETPGAHLFATDAAAFLADPALREEVFGPCCLLVRVRDLDEAHAVLHAVEGSLTVTLWGADDDTPEHRRLIATAQQVAGRVLFSGVPTGVAVTAAQHHGGPWPASTQPASTSVGVAAAERFLRPVALQDAPAWLIAARGHT